MPTKGFLSQAQKEQLQQLLREDDCPHFRERCLMMLLMNEGKTYEQIADFIGCSKRTVAYWCVHGDSNNLESLRDKREQGNHRKATGAYIQLLLSVIEKEPQEFGYEFGRWSGERLATYLADQTGIQLSGTQVREILRQKKYAYLWAKYSLEDKQEPDKRAAFKQKLERLLKSAKTDPERLQVWFWDETGNRFTSDSIRRKGWSLKGKRRKVTGQRRRGRVNVMGGLRDHDRKRLCFFIDKGNADSFLEQLRQLNNFVKQEWVNQGHLAEKFALLGAFVLVVLDNASYHKRKDIIKTIESELPNIWLEFLPAIVART